MTHIPPAYMGEYPGKLGLIKITGPTTLNTIFSKHGRCWSWRESVMKEGPRNSTVNQGKVVM